MVLFPPISAEEVRESDRTNAIKRKFSKKQMSQVPSPRMRQIQQSPSELARKNLFKKSPSSKLVTKHKTGINDPTSVMLNIDQMFDKVTGKTTDGKNLGFFVHVGDRNRIKGHSLAVSPSKVSSERSFLPPEIKEEQTKSMQKYERELKFKNRVLREKEKAIFNEGMKQKFSKNQISTHDLKSDSTLTNHR